MIPTTSAVPVWPFSGYRKSLLLLSSPGQDTWGPRVLGSPAWLLSYILGRRGSHASKMPCLKPKSLCSGVSVGGKTQHLDQTHVLEGNKVAKAPASPFFTSGTKAQPSFSAGCPGRIERFGACRAVQPSHTSLVVRAGVSR